MVHVILSVGSLERKSVVLIGTNSVCNHFTVFAHSTHPGYFKNRIALKLALGGGSVWSLANYSVVYEETQSNRASDFRDFVCSLFPKAILFYFCLTLL